MHILSKLSHLGPGLESLSSSSREKKPHNSPVPVILYFIENDRPLPASSGYNKISFPFPSRTSVRMISFQHSRVSDLIGSVPMCGLNCT
ncbi:hypothetical protein DERF_002682 [Dermatophagoides farinae]|uniref:Uncharacterized protein n=1 Tax=Dermatophagoides farinae TaxID=6954 RepID=A0A922IC27_DERFA|nr:hypothetical protein DERF_002682 [Dermatophagoides farinae]